MSMSLQEAKKSAKILVEKQVARMVEHAKTKYGIRGEFNLDVELKFNTYKSWGGTHHGGVPFIQLGLLYYIPVIQTSGNYDFSEYPSFAFNKEIGSLGISHWTKALTALIAHEIAHAIQFSQTRLAVDVLFASNGVVKSSELRGHGKLWKGIYRDLRLQFVNNISEVSLGSSESPVVLPKATPIVKPEVIPTVKTEVKPTTKKEWVVSKTRKNGGVICVYTNAKTGQPLLKLFDVQGKNILIFDAKNNKWIDSGSTSRVEVRNRFL